MGRESDSGAALTGARGGGTDTGRRRCIRGARSAAAMRSARGGEGFFGRSAREDGEKIPILPILDPKKMSFQHTGTVTNINCL